MQLILSYTCILRSYFRWECCSDLTSMYVCMHVCMYVRTYVCMYVRMRVCVCVYRNVHMYVCVCIYSYVYMYVCMYVCVCVYVYWYVPRMYVCMYSYVCMYVSNYVASVVKIISSFENRSRLRCPTPIFHTTKHFSNTSVCSTYKWYWKANKDWI